jgi:hypothetical protein
MAEQIKDGKGRSYLVGVNSENRMITSAVMTDLRTHVSRLHGQSYSIQTGVMTLSAADTWHWVLYWKNTSTTRNMHIVEIEYNWNGGSTNFNRPLQSKNVITTAGAPTANHTAMTPSNNNKNVAFTAEMDVYKWDGVGAGMTDATGHSGADTFHSQGRSLIDFSGSVVTGLNEYVGLLVKAPEVGDFSVGLHVFFLDKDEEI